MVELSYTVQKKLALFSKTKQLVNDTVKLPNAIKFTAIDDRAFAAHKSQPRHLHILKSFLTCVGFATGKRTAA
jgi:hypothetical protein